MPEEDFERLMKSPDMDEKTKVLIRKLRYNNEQAQETEGEKE